MTTTKTWRLGDIPWEPPYVKPRARVIIDNDFSGDPDGLVQLAHHVMSSSVDIRAIIGSHAHATDPSHEAGSTPQEACRRVADLFKVMGLDAADRIVPGADEPLTSRTIPRESPAARAIVDEAMRESDLPLFVACGGGLTDIASAYLLEPAIAERLTVIWIGGNELDRLADVEYSGPAFGPEYNLTIDIAAAQTVLTDSTLRVWQVPRDVYKQCVVSQSELRRRIGRVGATGRFLAEAVDRVYREMWEHGIGRAETYPMGDSPLVLLTALTNFWAADTSSSHHRVVPAPVVGDDGWDVPSSGTGRSLRPMRAYTTVDNRMMFEDLYAKLADLADWQGQ